MINSLPTKEDLIKILNDLEHHNNPDDINYVKSLLYLTFLNETVLNCADVEITERIYFLIDKCEKILYNNNIEEKDCICCREEIDPIEPWPSNREIIPEFLSPATIFLYRRN